MSSTWIFVLACVLLSGSDALRSSREASISFSQHPVQTTVKVVLAGFDADGSLGWRIDRTVLARTLQQLCPQVIPHARDPHPVKPLRVRFNVTYSVIKTHSRPLDSALTSALMRAHQKNAYHDGVLVIDIDDQLRSVFAGVAGLSDSSVADFTVLVTNPRPNAVAGGFPTNVTYGYRYEGGAITQHWVGHERYVVLDYSAGPVQYGNAEDSDAVFSSYTFKALEKHYLDARIASHVVAAVRQVWVPDVSHISLSHADRILIPLLVFRNHQQWHSFEDKHLDIAAIKRELTKIKRPNQELHIVTGVHHLHDHPHIALELAKAMRHDSVHEMDLNGQFGITQRPFLDSARLFAGLRGAADPLAEELLLPEADKAAHAAFFSKSAGVLANSSVKAEGTHILPVYIFSVIDYAKNLLFDKESLVHATSDAVIVLQSAETALPLSYFQMKDTTYLDATMSTRHVIAGLATALAGLLGPDGYYSPLHNRIISDLTFANGHHPFGPFSNCTSLSTLQSDIYLRNLVLSNIESAADSLTNAIVQINKFADAFIGSVDNEKIDETDNWIEFLYHRGEDDTSPVAFTTVARLHTELDKIYASLADIVGLVSERKYQEAYQRSVGFGRQAAIFDSYIDSEIENAELQLLCCQVTFEAPEAEDDETDTTLGLLRLVLFLTLVVSAGTVYFLRRFKPQRSRLVL